ncbi:IS3 family transposase [Albirhodobacter sp. R86504]|uniref:IS3 family transposase n=1 Tax=Albirhodobacter sp. R86504 TaxID=3093848 RepID=UPI003671006B
MSIQRRSGANARPIASIRKEMQVIASERLRFGYRRIGIVLDRKGMSMTHKKLYRIYREEGLSVKRRRGRKRARGTATPMPSAEGVNARWSLDFVSDSFGARASSGSSP